MKNLTIVVAAVFALSACASAPMPTSVAARDQNRLGVEQASKRAQEMIQKAGISDGPFGVF